MIECVKKYMIIWTRAGKALLRIQYSFFIKKKNTFRKQDYRGFSQSDTVASKTTTITMRDGEMLAFPLRMRMKQSCPAMLLLWMLYQIC